MTKILNHYHSSPYGGHFKANRIVAKVFPSGFYLPIIFKDSHNLIATCDRCQRIGNISKRHEAPLTNILEVELFIVWGVNFKGLFLQMILEWLGSF